MIIATKFNLGERVTVERHCSPFNGRSGEVVGYSIMNLEGIKKIIAAQVKLDPKFKGAKLRQNELIREDWLSPEGVSWESK